MPSQRDTSCCWGSCSKYWLSYLPALMANHHSFSWTPTIRIRSTFDSIIWLNTNILFGLLFGPNRILHPALLHSTTSVNSWNYYLIDGATRDATLNTQILRQSRYYYCFQLLFKMPSFLESFQVGLCPSKQNLGGKQQQFILLADVLPAAQPTVS